MRISALSLKAALVAAAFAMPITAAHAAPISYANAIMADAPVAYWRFGESPGATTAIDSSGNANNGTYSGTVELGQPGIGGGDTSALFNSGGALDGRAVAPDSATLNPGQITIEALISWAGDNGFQQRIIEKSRFSGGQLPQYGLNILPNGHVLFEFQVGTDQFAIESIGGVQIGVGVDVAATYDGDFMRIYINGILDNVAADGVVGNTIPHDLTDVGIGNQVDRDRPFNGIIDELAIFGSALSGDQLLAHVNAVPEPSTIVMFSIGLLGLARQSRVRHGVEKGARVFRLRGATPSR